MSNLMLHHQHLHQVVKMLDKLNEVNVVVSCKILCHVIKQDP